MKWSNVTIIFLRETKDQLRDRRTLFTIAVLPLLLYPLLGMTVLQISQFLQEHPTKVWVIGSTNLPEDPALIQNDRLVADGEDLRLIHLTVADDKVSAADEDLEELAREKIRRGEAEAVLVFPDDFAERLRALQSSVRESIRGSEGEVADNAAPEVPSPRIIYDSANQKSDLAYKRIQSVLKTWRETLVHQGLEQNAVPAEATRPFQLVESDVAKVGSRRAAAWSKILPLILMVWALTGAFYPAVDLCAGEKERGTLETLLSSPAKRSEIVWGKLLTVMSFSMATSLLNLVSMGCTGLFIIRQMSQAAGGGAALDLGPPPLTAMIWLLPALVPVSALFGALALAIAAFARSSKEGQYYLLPLLMITLPLIILPMLPSVELELGTSLIPVTGLVLLLRALIEGQYAEAAVYFPIVALVTGLCCLFAVRWAIEQFRNESVLFRENERFGVGVWVRHLVRDRSDTPSFAEAIVCGVMLLLIRFFASMLAAAPTDWPSFVVTMLITQVALFATPPILMACCLTKSPMKSLLLRWPAWKTIPLAILLAAFLHPSATWLSQGINYLYPIKQDTEAALLPFYRIISEAPLLHVVLLMALVPAICEELAFRGFILSGLRHMGHKWAAIALCSVFFGLAHGMLQQSLSAFVLGCVIGYVAVQTGSLLPAIAFHFTHNALALSVSRVNEAWMSENAWSGYAIYAETPESVLYRWPFALITGLIALALLRWFQVQPYQRYDEESLTEVLAHEPTEPVREKSPVERKQARSGRVRESSTREGLRKARPSVPQSTT